MHLRINLLPPVRFRALKSFGAVGKRKRERESEQYHLPPPGVTFLRLPLSIALFIESQQVVPKTKKKAKNAASDVSLLWWWWLRGYTSWNFNEALLYRATSFARGF